MFASITHVTVRLEKAEEATRVWRDEIMPIAHTLSGWKGAELFADLHSGEGLAVNFYESEAAILAAESSDAFHQIMAKLTPLVAAPPTRKIYAVAGQVR